MKVSGEQQSGDSGTSSETFPLTQRLLGQQMKKNNNKKNNKCLFQPFLGFFSPLLCKKTNVEVMGGRSIQV